jgi:hypothetical protein
MLESILHNLCVLSDLSVKIIFYTYLNRSNKLYG